MKSAGIGIVFVGLLLALIGCGPGPGAPKKKEPPVDPFAPRISINSAQNYTQSTAATLSLSAVDALEMYITQDSTCEAGGTWDTYNTSKAWTLTQSNALNTVYFKVRNATATSTCVSDTITHDTVAPTLMIVTPLTGGYINLSNRASFPFQGTCNETGATIQITGSITDSVTCSFGTFSKNLNLTSVADGAVTLTAQVTDLAGNSSSTSSVNLTKDTIAPTLTLTGPASGSVFDASEAASVTISGTCSEDTRTIAITGIFSDSITCTSGAWSKTYDLTSQPDGELQVRINHSDAAGNTATEISATYTKDTTAPTLVISSPAENGYVSSSNYTAYTVGGTCSEDGRTVNVSGAFTASAVCTSGFWGFNYNFTAIADGPLSISATLSDAAGNTTTTAARNFTKDIMGPQSPTISIEAGAATTTSASATLTLSATDADQMYITNISGCASGGTWEAFNTAKVWTLPTANATNTVYVKYRDAARNESTCVSDDIYLDLTAPNLTFTTPANGAWVNIANETAFQISGACGAEGEDVVISGSIDATVPCTGGAWTATVDVSVEIDGTDTVTFTVDHMNSGGLAATPVTRNFSKDTVAPGDVSVSNPAANPYASSATTISIAGSCNDSNGISTTGAQTLTGSCSGGSYSLSLTQTVDGSYDYTVHQTDAAGNTSTGFIFTWILDSTIPGVPNLTSPIPNPIINNDNSIIISGSCTTGNTVDLSGDLVASDVTSPAGSLTQTCSSNAFSYTIQKTIDGTYDFSVIQTNIAEVSSGAATVQWTRDTIAPTPIVISNPPTDPYTAGGNLTVTGSCESGATVYMTGSSVQNTLCSNGAFSFSVSKATDATYNFSFLQTDAAENSSTSETQQWIRDSSVLPAPVITTPSTSPYTSNTTSLVVSGTCVTGYTVTLSSGALASDVTSPAGSLTQVCTNSQFSYTISKATDNTYTFNFTQTDGARTSPATAQTWVRDTTPPNTTLTKNPTNPNYKLSSIFEFTSPDTTATFECNLDSAGWSACTSPVSYATISNGNHVFEVRAVDLATNADPTPATFSWAQEAYNSVALYHFDSGTETVDSSLYAGLQNNPLTAFASPTSEVGNFAESVNLASASSQYLAAADNDALDVLNERMTIEFWVKFDSYPSTNNQYAMLVTKSGAAGNIGWEVGMKRASGGYRLTLRAALDGTTVIERRASSECFSDTTTWHHVAVTFNKGAVRFFCDGVAKGSATIGTAGTSVIFNSSAQLRIGRGQTVSATYQQFNGSIDELRLSQTLRWNTNYTVPTSAFTPD